MNHEARIARLEGLPPKQNDLELKVAAMSDDELEEAVREIVTRTTGYTGHLSAHALGRVSRILHRCNGVLSALSSEDSEKLSLLLGGEHVACI